MGWSCQYTKKTLNVFYVLTGDFSAKKIRRKLVVQKRNERCKLLINSVEDMTLDSLIHSCKKEKAVRGAE